jgi:hypothetical protein
VGDINYDYDRYLISGLLESEKDDKLLEFSQKASDVTRVDTPWTRRGFPMNGLNTATCIHPSMGRKKENNSNYKDTDITIIDPI